MQTDDFAVFPGGYDNVYIGVGPVGDFLNPNECPPYPTTRHSRPSKLANAQLEASGNAIRIELSWLDQHRNTGPIASDFFDGCLFPFCTQQRRVLKGVPVSC